MGHKETLRALPDMKGFSNGGAYPCPSFTTAALAYEHFPHSEK